MPIPINQVTVAEVIIHGTMAAAGSSITPAINRFFYRRVAVAVTPTKAALNTIFQSTVVAPLLLAANVRYTPGYLTIRWVNDALDSPTAFNVAGVGNVATDGQPSDDACYMLLRTALRGKPYRGSKHFAGVNEIDTTGDVLTGAGLVRWQAVQTAVAAALTDATPNTWNPTILSMGNEAAPLSQLKANPTTVTVNDVTAVLLDLNVGTMRRRRSKTVR